jgi:hypothetical protein
MHVLIQNVCGGLYSKSNSLEKKGVEREEVGYVVREKRKGIYRIKEMKGIGYRTGSKVK